MHEYMVQVQRVIDGDTLDVDVDLGFHTHIHTDVRLARINAPEMTQPAGLVACAFVTDLVGKAKQVKIYSTRQEKYGRWLAEVYLLMKSTDVVWLNLNDELVKQHHAAYKNYD